MAFEDITLSMTSCACTGCGATTPPRDGRCPGCGGETFDAVFVKTSEGVDDEALQEGHAALGAAAWKREREYALKGVAGLDLARWSTLSVEALMAAIQEQRKAEARRNLKKGQGVCPACGVVFNKAHSGPTTQGFCSAYCQKRAARGVAAEAAAAPSPARPGGNPSGPVRVGGTHRIGSRGLTFVAIAMLLAVPLAKVVFNAMMEDDAPEFSYRMGERRLEGDEEEEVGKVLTAWLDELKAGRPGDPYWEKKAPEEGLGPVGSPRILGMAGIGKSGGVRAKVSPPYWHVFLVKTPEGWKVSAVERQRDR